MAGLENARVTAGPFRESGAQLLKQFVRRLALVNVTAGKPTAVQRTGQLMYELSTLYPDVSGIRPEYGWDAPYARTSDGLPYIGPHRNFPHQLFAFGDSSRGMTGAYLASRMLLRHHVDDLESADRHFGFTRHGG